jgi:S1-C subfamily serine protease
VAVALSAASALVYAAQSQAAAQGITSAPFGIGGEADREIDAVLVDYDATERMRTKARRSVVSLRAAMTQDALATPGTAPTLEGGAVAIEAGGARFLLSAAATLGGEQEASVVLGDGKVVTAKRHAELPDVGLVLLTLVPWPTQLVPAELAPEGAPRRGAPALALTGLGRNTPEQPSMEVVSKVYLMDTPEPEGESKPTEGVWVTDLELFWGYPLLDPSARLLALTFARAEGTGRRSLAADANAIRKALAEMKPRDPASTSRPPR